MSANKTVGEAIKEFYDQHDFGDDGGINEKFAWIKFGFFSIPIPNVEGRSKNIYMHDVSHIVTGNDTTWRGESAVAAWEIGAGGWQNLFVPWLLTLWAMGLGVLFYPNVVLASFKQALTMQNALTCGLSKSEIFKFPVSDLQKFLSNKPKSKKTPFVWMALGFAIFIFPFVIGFLTIWLIFKIY